MSVRLHNTLTGQKEPFEPAEPDHARIYVCGPTVFDYAHLGHARCYVVYDVLVRHLRSNGLRVTYVRNITDVDDKILKRASETGTEPTALAAKFAEAYAQDMHRLGNLDPDVEPRVSTHLEDIFALVQRLIDREHAYVSDGDVYFSVESFPEYGKLSHRDLGQMKLGASDRLDFTVIGPAVNEASRIQALCRPLDRSILLSGTFHEAAGSKHGLESLGFHELRGVREPQELYGLAG